MGHVHSLGFSRLYPNGGATGHWVLCCTLFTSRFATAIASVLFGYSMLLLEGLDYFGSSFVEITQELITITMTLPIHMMAQDPQSNILRCSKHLPACPCLFLFCFHLGLKNSDSSGNQLTETLRLRAWSRTVSPYFARRYSSVLKCRGTLAASGKKKIANRELFARPCQRGTSGKSLRHSTIFEEFKDVERYYVDLCTLSKI